jgi:hypothetical protein
MMALGNAIVGAEPEWINRSVVTQLVWLAWNVVSMAGGGYVTVWIAPSAKVAHAIVMGSIQTVFTLVALLGTVLCGANVCPAGTSGRDESGLSRHALQLVVCHQLVSELMRRSKSAKERRMSSKVLGSVRYMSRIAA